MNFTTKIVFKQYYITMLTNSSVMVNWLIMGLTRGVGLHAD